MSVNLTRKTRSARRATSTLEPAIRWQLDRLRGLIRNYVSLQTIVWTTLFALGAFWIGGLLDYAPVWLGSSESPQMARIAMLAIVLIGSLWIAIKYGLSRLLVRWPYGSLALLLERHYPHLQSRLVTTVQSDSYQELKTQPEVDSISVELLDRTRRAAAEDVAKLDVVPVLRWQALQFQLGFLVFAMMLSIAFAAWQPNWTAHWIKRLLTLSNEPWPRLARLRVDGIEFEVPGFTGVLLRQRILIPFQGGVARVTRGRSVTLRVAADLSAKLIPEACNVTYYLADGGRGRASMRRLSSVANSSWQSFSLDGPPLEAIDQTLDLVIIGGDVRLSNVHIETVDSPVLADLALQIEYPKYLQTTTRSIGLTETQSYRNGMRLPQGTHVTLLGRSNKPLSQVDYTIVSASQNKDDSPSVRSLVATGNEFQLTLDRLDESALVEFRLWDADHLCSDRIQQYVLTVLPDEVPRIDLALKGIGSAITPNASLPFHAKIQDDHGIRNAWLELTLNATQPTMEAVSPKNDGQVDSIIDLRELRESHRLVLAVGSTLGLTLASDDYFDLRDQPRIGSASPIQLAVVTPDQLLVLLERRELAMRSRLELIISEFQQMRDLLQRILSDNSASISPNGVSLNVQDVPAGTADDNLDPQRTSRMQTLRAQQSSMQTKKSEGELSGVEQEIGRIREELVNNRIDSEDRQTRLEIKVRQPIQAILSQHFPELIKQLRILESDLSRGTVLEDKIRLPMQTSDQILVELQGILQNMIDIQDFNELVDMVRKIVEDQQSLLDKTKAEQTKQVLDLFKERN